MRSTRILTIDDTEVGPDVCLFVLKKDDTAESFCGTRSKGGEALKTILGYAEKKGLATVR